MPKSENKDIVYKVKRVKKSVDDPWKRGLIYSNGHNLGPILSLTAGVLVSFKAGSHPVSPFTATSHSMGSLAIYDLAIPPL